MKMKKIVLCVGLACLLGGSLATGQSEPAQPKTLASTMNVYVFPTEGQDAKQQSMDEAECYNWAVQNTGTDPFALQKQAEQTQAQAEQQKQQVQGSSAGAGAAGAVKGAAAGALIGEIANDDAGKGAAYGAAAGLIAGRRRGRQAEKQAQNQIEQQSQASQAATQEQITNFKKAFSVCLEAKKYLVKY
jgi:hypothetical protein